MKAERTPQKYSKFCNKRRGVGFCWTGFLAPPYADPRAALKTRTLGAQRWMGLVDPPTRRARVCSASHQLPCAALDSIFVTPLRRPDRLRFSSRATSLRWTSPIDPPTQMFSNVFSGRVCARPLDGPFGTPLRDSCPRYKKWGALTACAGRGRVTPLRTRPWDQIPRTLVRFAGRGRATPLRDSCPWYKKWGARAACAGRSRVTPLRRSTPLRLFFDRRAQTNVRSLFSTEFMFAVSASFFF